MSVFEQALKHYEAVEKLKGQAVQVPTAAPIINPSPYVDLAKASVNNIQHGGSHYKKYGDLQPWDVVIKWNLGYLEGTALKYIARWRDKGGIQDIQKAIHFLQKLVEVEESKRGLYGGS